MSVSDGRLHPEIAAALTLFPSPDVDHGDIAAIRAQASRYMSERGGPAPQFDDPRVQIVSGSVAGVDVLVWTPREVSSFRPWVLAAHGGGFVVGSALGAERVAVPLAAEHGVVTVSVEYPLAPENPAPAALDACWAVLAECRRAGRVAGVALDPDRVAVHGSSAGACLAAGVALRARDARLPVALQSLSCPALDDRPAPSVWSPTWSAQASDWMWRHYLGTGTADPYVVPAAVTDVAGVASAYVVVAEHDVLRRDGVEYARRLDDAGVDVTVLDVAGTVHGFDGLMSATAPGRAAIDAQVSALATALQP